MVSQKQYKLVPPDGGWGYFIAVGVILHYAGVMTFATSFGIMYRDLIEELRMSTTIVTSVGAISGICVAISAYIAGPLLKVLSTRKVALIGTILNNMGSFGLIFVKTQAEFFACIAAQATGAGFIVNICSTVLNCYFQEKRLQFMTFTQAVPAVTSMLAPVFLGWSLQQYGYRGTMLLICGLSLQGFVASALLQPVEWHMKRIDVVDEVPEGVSLLNSSSFIERPIAKKEQTIKITVKDTSTSLSLKDSKLDTSITSKSLENGTQHVKDSEEKKKIISIIGEMLDWSIFKNFLLFNACFGLALCLFANFNYLLMLPQALYTDHWNENTVSFTFYLLGFGDIAARGLFIVFGKFFAKIGSRVVYMMGLAIAVVTRLCILWSKSQMAIQIFMTVLGSSHCIITSFPPMVLSEMTDQKTFPSAIGMMMLLFGTVSLLFGPIIGAIRDLTNSYETTFYIITSCFAIILMFWSIEMCYASNQKKMQLRAVSETKRKANKRRK